MRPVSRTKNPVGRPKEGRVKVTWYVKPKTECRVKSLVNKVDNTPGKALDRKMGVTV